MSLALDLALFFRNSKTKLGLSLSARGIVFTLAFRVGSNSNTWISAEVLAQECGVLRQNLHQPLDNIIATKLVKRKPNNKDKRKNTYSFNELIVNYHHAL